jgi:hypothetical protein
VNGVPVNITQDKIVVNIDRKYNMTTPAVSKEGDVSGGTAGVAVIELLPADTNKLVKGKNEIQIVWELFGGDRKFIIYDDQIDVNSVIK